MNNPFETLRKILRNEAARGYDNKGMIGGLDKYIPALESQARQLEFDQDLVDDIVARLRQYPSLPPSDRADALSAILARLPTAAPPQPRPRPAPAPKESAEDETAQEARGREAESKEKEREKEEEKQEESSIGALRRPQRSLPQKAQRPPRSRPAPSGRPPRQPLPPAPAGIGLDAPLTVLHGIGGKNSENLRRLGLRTMRDALTFFPRRYVDYSKLRQISRLEYGEEVTIIATVRESYVQKIRGGQSTMVKSVLTDGTGAIEVTWFNQHWIADKLTPGQQVQVSGRVTQYLGRLTLSSPEWEPLDQESLNTGRIVPIYNLTKGIRAGQMRRWMYEAVGYTAPRVPDPLPPDVRDRHRLMSYSEALLQIHFPDAEDVLAAARRRLAFDELLLLQLGVKRQRIEWQSEPGQPLAAADADLERWMASLPYRLTGAQSRALAEVRGDLARSKPMNRLLQGDVGSGKTVVAALAMAIAFGTGAQAALMSPTAVLAEQHYRTLASLLANIHPPCRAALLLGSTPDSEKQAIHDGLRDGSINIVVGTQSLIQERVEFANLGLVVVDEQHRFGVAQRAKLRGKGGNPHLLVMTATPIPRTLALTLYGDLDLSVIDEMPPGRRPVETRVLYVDERERAYAYIRAQVQQGRQAFIICPLVEESDKVEAKAAIEEHERLQEQVFPDLRLGLLHGRMRADEKEAAMAAFRDGQTNILVSTSVVEVGVDVPNATVMLVEGANRFGLAQLHQFRGRVGRGPHPSYCLLVSDQGASAAGDGDARLRAMEETHDGFVLAEKDLEIRGPGEFLGTRQAGFGDLRLAKLTDLPLIDLARREADALLAADPNLENAEHRLLAERLAEFWRELDGAGDVS